MLEVRLQWDGSPVDTRANYKESTTMTLKLGGIRPQPCDNELPAERGDMCLKPNSVDAWYRNLAASCLAKSQSTKESGCPGS